MSLAARVVVRGRYYPGWDIVMATTGTFVAATRPVRDVLALAADVTAPGAQSVPAHSLLCALLPGYLDLLRPWEYWAHTVTFALVVTTLVLIATALRLPVRRWWIVLLAWAASPALLSFALAGFPWASAFLPHALALVAVLHPRVRRSWVLGPVLCAAALVTAWQVYDLGKTVFVVFLAGAVLLRDVPVGSRLLWLATGALQLYLVAAHPSGPSVRFMSPDALHPWALLGGARRLVAGLLVDRTLDLPFLLAAALVALAAVPRDRLFLASQLAAQLGLVLLLAAVTPLDLRARRCLLVGYSAIVIVAAAFRGRTRSRAHVAIAVLLAVGTGAQLVDLIAFARAPRPPVAFPLPHTFSQTDYMVVKAPIDWAARMGEDVLAGDTVIAVYGPLAYDENASNPTGVLERVYLRVGHDRFVHSVFAFTAYRFAITSYPIRPLSTVDTTLDAVAAAARERSSPVVLYYSQDFHRTFVHGFETESAIVFAAVRERFALRDPEVLSPTLLRFRLVPRPPDAAAEIAITDATGTLEPTAPASAPAIRIAWSGLPFERYWVVDQPRPPSPYVDPRPWGAAPFRARLRGTLVVEQPGRYEFVLGADEATDLLLDGVTIASTSAGQPRIVTTSRSLAAGAHALEATATDDEGLAHLLVDVRRAGD